MKQPIFTGCGVAIITPFTCDSVDYPALRKLIDFQLTANTDAIIVCGTTGEASTMSYIERMRTIETVVRHVDGQIPVIAGTGSNNTETAIILSKDAVLAGVDGLLVVTPYYNKATQVGLQKHYTAIADLVTKPMILYNVPGRTGVTCTAETYATLASHPNIIGVKEASGDFSLIQKTRELCPEDFYIWSGNDEETAATMMLGGVGVISVAANIVPKEMHRLTSLCRSGDFTEAGKLQIHLRRLMAALFTEVNPIPVKTALAAMGLCEEQFRLPLCEMGKNTRENLMHVLTNYALI